MNQNQLILLIVVVLAVAAVAIFTLKTRRTKRLRARFGPEYGRAVQESGSAERGERHLEKLEKRVEKYHIRSLQPAEKERLGESWRSVQARFVDDPRNALQAADRLLTEAMAAKGYPMGDFEEQVADLSVNHALVVEHYRAGHEIAVSDSRGQTTTEELRQAMIHYRKLFDELVGEAEWARTRTAAV